MTAGPTEKEIEEELHAIHMAKLREEQVRNTCYCLTQAFDQQETD